MITGGAAWGLWSQPWGHSPSKASSPRQEKGEFPLDCPGKARLHRWGAYLNLTYSPAIKRP